MERLLRRRKCLSARNWMPSRKKRKASYEHRSCHRH
ncbi:hypothetical protein MTO96_043162, partial [Rhipicephalus appendiculatus]